MVESERDYAEKHQVNWPANPEAGMQPFEAEPLQWRMRKGNAIGVPGDRGRSPRYQSRTEIAKQRLRSAQKKTERPLQKCGNPERKACGRQDADAEGPEGGRQPRAPIQ